MHQFVGNGCIAFGIKQSVIAPDQFGNARTPGTYDRTSASHSFEDRQAKTFMPGRKDKGFT
jgi:hypothetical protein